MWMWTEVEVVGADVGFGCTWEGGLWVLLDKRGGMGGKDKRGGVEVGCRCGVQDAGARCGVQDAGYKCGEGDVEAAAGCGCRIENASGVAGCRRRVQRAGCRQVQDADVEVDAGPQCPWNVGCRCRMQIEDPGHKWM